MEERLISLPQNLEAECALLGLVLNNSKDMNDIIGILKPKDFYRDAHNKIFSSMVDMYSQDKNIDVVTISEELRKDDKLAEVGGVTYLAQLMGSVIISDSIIEYARIIKEKSNKRELIKASKDMMEKAYQEGTDAKEIIGQIEDSLFSISIDKQNQLEHISKSLETTLDHLDELYNNGGGFTGLSTGFTAIDNQINGLQKGDLVILAARPSMGKTALALNLCINVGKKNHTALFSLEMSKEQVTQRMISSITKIELQKIRTAKLEDNEWKRIGEYTSYLSQRNIEIDDTAGQTVNEIKAKCKKLKIKQALDLVVIDYLGLVEPTGKSQSREQEISKISRSLKKMAKELDITVIALSQLSRAPEQRTNHRPQLSDLRESGSIEQDADIVMFLYRDEYYNMESEDKNIAECIIAKSRNGEVGTVKLGWLGQYQWFHTLDCIRR